MKLAHLYESEATVTTKLLELQDWLLDKGWDDVELKHVKDGYNVILSCGPGRAFTRNYWCTIKGSELTWWGGLSRDPNSTKYTTESIKELALAELAYINVRHVLKVKFMEKPDRFQDVIALDSPVPYSKLKPLYDAGVLTLLTGNDLYGKPGRPTSPIAGINTRIGLPAVFIVNFGISRHDCWLVDSTGASSYLREWAAINLQS